MSGRDRPQTDPPRSIVSDIPADLRYTADHEWVRHTGDDTMQVGITDFAQDSLGDVVYVQLPEVGATLTAGESFGEVESTKSVSDLYAPLSATVIAVNTELEGILRNRIIACLCISRTNSICKTRKQCSVPTV